MGKMKPSKENQIEFVASEIVKELERWEYLRKYGGRDPFWPDGVNMNFIRNHIISYKRQLEELCETDVLPEAESVPVGVCEICGSKNDVMDFQSSSDFIRHYICSSCVSMSEEKRNSLNKDQQSVVFFAKILFDDSEE